MNIDILSKSIINQNKLKILFDHIDFEIENTFKQGYITPNEKMKIDSNWKNMSLNQLHQKLIIDKSEIYWKFAIGIIANLSIPDFTHFLNKNNHQLLIEKYDLNELTYIFIDTYFDEIKPYIDKYSSTMTTRFGNQLEKYCKKNFEKMHHNLDSFCILASVIDLSKYGDGIWKTYEETIFKEYFKGPFKLDKQKEYVKFWTYILKYQKIPNILMKRFIPYFVEFHDLRNAILFGKYSKEYISLFKGTGWYSKIKNLETNHH